jgi:translocation and assembly module TamA
LVRVPGPRMRRMIRPLLRVSLAFVGCLLVSLPAAAGIDVRIRGLGSDEETNCYKQIALLAYAIRVDAEKAQHDVREVERLFKQGEQDIRTAMQPFGWYNVEVKSELRGSSPDWTATYTVDAGPPTTVAKIDVLVDGVGKDNPAIDRVKRAPRIAVGERLKHERYEELKGRLQDAAYGEGYLDARFTRHQLRVDALANTAEILVTFETGPRWYFGEVEIDQASNLDNEFLRRYSRMIPGTPFDSGKVLATQFSFTDLDYFKSVEIETQKAKAGPDRHIPVIIHAQAKKPYLFRFGAGYGTDTGPRALAGVEFRRLTSTGHKLRIELRPSQHISTAIAEYKIPYGNFAGDSISFPVQGLRQDFQGIDEELYSLGVSYNRQIGQWQRRYYLTYTHDTYSLEDSPQATSILLTPGLALSRTSADDPIFPRRGWYVFFDVHGASTAVLSDTTFIETLLRVRTVLPIADGVRLLLRGEEGVAFVRRFSTLPPSQRFFAGGDDSVRGYAYHSLGPRDERGRVIGGKFLTTGSAELVFDVYKNYGLAVFADAGGADDVPNVLLHYGAGLGLRYRAPFGAIAVDLAHPFDRDASPVRLHLGVRIGL